MATLLEELQEKFVEIALFVIATAASLSAAAQMQEEWQV